MEEKDLENVNLNENEKAVTEENKKTASDENEKCRKKKKNIFVRILTGLLIFILVLIVLLAGFITFSALNRKNVLEVLPQDFCIYVHTDNVWNTVEPLFDLEAADLLLSEPEFVDLRGIFMELRASSIRKSKLLSFAGNKKVDIAIYKNELVENSFDFLACVNLGELSFATRIAKVILPYVNVPGVSLNEKNGIIKYQSLEDETQGVTYFRIEKNLVLVSGNETLLEKTFANNNNYSEKDKSLLTEKCTESIKVFVNAKSLAQNVTQGDEMLTNIISVVPDNSLSTISFDVNKESLNLKAKIPFKSEKNSKLNVLLTKPSSTPSLLSRLSGNVQYYTLINAGSLKELKDAAFECLSDKQNAEDLWSTGNKASKILFSVSLDDLIFSWTGNEFAVLGIENLNDPVFAIQIKDESQRQKVFDKFISSIIIRDDSSLILDGIRLPKIMLPDFIQSILSLFKVSLPAPYYMVRDGFIYFSENPETLSALYTTTRDGDTLLLNENYMSVCSAASSGSTVKLYYNLERSLPFFLRSNVNMSQVLKLYSLGTFDVTLDGNFANISLTGVSNKNLNSRIIPGFPKTLEGKTDGKIVQQEKEIFWVEDKTVIKAMEIPSTKIYSYKAKDNVFIAATAGQNEGKLWAVTTFGEVYLLDNQLNVLEGWPVLTGQKTGADISSFADSVIIPGENGTVCIVKTDGSVKLENLNLNGSIKSPAAVLGNTAALYDKSFMGRILYFEDGNLKDNVSVFSGIGFGTPSLMEKNSVIYSAFITQNGTVYVWNNSELAENFPVKLEGVYYTNLVNDGKNFYALSENAELTRIGLDGKTLSVKIPYATAKEGVLFAKDKVYVCPDGNTLYAFNSSMELVKNYPLIGFGNPAFADVNGDNKKDCFTLSIDSRLYAWNMR